MNHQDIRLAADHKPQEFLNNSVYPGYDFAKVAYSIVHHPMKKLNFLLILLDCP